MKLPLYPSFAVAVAIVVPLAVLALWDGGDAAPGADPEGPVLVVGGDLNLGRRQNRITAEAGPEAALRRIPELAKADLAYANLESVVATTGDYRVEKGEEAEYYYRARPEMLAVLTRAGIDVVGTANNHSGDYGDAAMLEQRALLDAWGIAHTGAGADFETACAPVVRRAGDLAVAFFAIDATMKPFAASATEPGTCWLDLKDPEAWRRHIEPRAAAAREYADLVMVGVHWGSNGKTEPTERLIAAGHALVDGGADAVLGSSAHVLHGVEVYRGRPILHDAGNLLFDSYDVERTESAVFSLVLGPYGVRAVSATPIWVEYGTSRVATGQDAASILAMLEERSRKLGTETTLDGERLRFPIPEPQARPAPPRRAGPNALPPPEPEIAQTNAPPGCMAAEVPEDARIEPVAMGPLKLVGRRVGPAKMVGRDLVDIETWWTVDAPVERDLWLEPRAQHLGSSHRWAGTHDGCDWVWPVGRWEPGAIWYDRYAMRPSRKPQPGDYRVEIAVEDREGAVAVHEIGALTYEER